jgi:hypothetical protein
MVDRVTHLVVIAREGVPEVTEFTSFNDAADYYDLASPNWSESYLTVVVNGPGRPLHRTIDPHMRPDIVALREASGTVCIDEDCNLSGGHAHAGPCEPCGCPLRHAIVECPETW